MDNVNRIITARDYALQEGAQTVRARIDKRVKKIIEKHSDIKLQLNKVSKIPVYARIELGQWVADCECGGCEFVDPDEPVFFCFSCANRENAGMMREAIFPKKEKRQEIEKLILARPINDQRGIGSLERAHMARPLIVTETEGGEKIPLTRTWNHGEPIENLQRENEVIEKYLKAKEGE